MQGGKDKQQQQQQQQLQQSGLCLPPLAKKVTGRVAALFTIKNRADRNGGDGCGDVTLQRRVDELESYIKRAYQRLSMRMQKIDERFDLELTTWGLQVLEQGIQAFVLDEVDSIAATAEEIDDCNDAECCLSDNEQDDEDEVVTESRSTSSVRSSKSGRGGVDSDDSISSSICSSSSSGVSWHEHGSSSSSDAEEDETIEVDGGKTSSVCSSSSECGSDGSVEDSDTENTQHTTRAKDLPVRGKKRVATKKPIESPEEKLKGTDKKNGIKKHRGMQGVFGARSSSGLEALRNTYSDSESDGKQIDDGEVAQEEDSGSSSDSNSMSSSSSIPSPSRCMAPRKRRRKQLEPKQCNGDRVCKALKLSQEQEAEPGRGNKEQVSESEGGVSEVEDEEESDDACKNDKNKQGESSSDESEEEA